MKEEVKSALTRGTAFLFEQQCKDGNFEGQLSSSTFPTCAYAWIELVRGEIPDPSLIEWFIANQNEDGGWGLDTANISNTEADPICSLNSGANPSTFTRSVPPKTAGIHSKINTTSRFSQIGLCRF